MLCFKMTNYSKYIIKYQKMAHKFNEQQFKKKNKNKKTTNIKLALLIRSGWFTAYVSVSGQQGTGLFSFLTDEAEFKDTVTLLG